MNGSIASMLRALLLLGAGMLVLGGLSPAGAAYPEKLIRIVVPYAPGGPNDIVARVLAQELAVRWNQQVVVENRPGGGATIGGLAVAKAPADGYTLLLASSTFAAHPGLFPNLPYDLQKDFVPVVKIGDGPIILVANPAFPASNVTELIDYAKRNPGKVSFGTSGTAGTPHLSGEYFNLRSKAGLTHIPYKGDAPAIIGVLNGSTALAFTGLTAAMPQVRSGKLKAIAVTTSTRVEVLPEVPTMAESGLPGFELAGWFSLLAPANTPTAIVNNIAEAVLSILANPEVKAKVTASGVVVAPMGPVEFKPFMASEISKLTELINAAKIKAE